MKRREICSLPWSGSMSETGSWAGNGTCLSAGGHFIKHCTPSPSTGHLNSNSSGHAPSHSIPSSLLRSILTEMFSKNIFCHDVLLVFNTWNMLCDGCSVCCLDISEKWPESCEDDTFDSDVSAPPHDETASQIISSGLHFWHCSFIVTFTMQLVCQCIY